MRFKPSIRPTETYTETNFLRLYTAPLDPDAPTGRHAMRVATIEHLVSGTAGVPGFRCQTIVDGEAMTREDALMIARGYAAEHCIPVIYECHSD